MVAVKHREVLLVRLIKVFEHFESFIVNLCFQLQIGFKRIFCGDKVLYLVKRRNKIESDRNAYRRADSAHVLRTVNGFDGVSRDVGKELAGKVVQSAAVLTFLSLASSIQRL